MFCIQLARHFGGFNGHFTNSSLAVSTKLPTLWRFQVEHGKSGLSKDTFVYQLVAAQMFRVNDFCRPVRVVDAGHQSHRLQQHDSTRLVTEYSPTNWFSLWSRFKDAIRQMNPGLSPSAIGQARIHSNVLSVGSIICIGNRKL